MVSCNVKRGAIGGIGLFLLTGNPWAGAAGVAAGVYTCPGTEFPIIGVRKPGK